MIAHGKWSSSLTEDYSPKSARKNLLTVAAVLAALAVWNVHRHRILYTEILGGLALVLCLTILASRTATELLDRSWMAFGKKLGYINSLALLTLFYYIVLMPFSFFLRLGGHDPLYRRRKGTKSYWVRRESPSQSKNQFERSF